ncbi:MAG: DnaT-like ssDNA-binding domain-containing protein, partial [Plesiomonas shigelloides]
GGAGQNDPIDKAKIDRSNRPKRSVLNGSKRPDLTENTTEITTENLSPRAREPAVILPEVQNAILTQRVQQVSRSLTSKFPMTLIWDPGPDFDEYARRLGMTTPAYSEAQLNEFRMYWEPTGRCFHHTQWIQKFVQRLKSDLARGLTNDHGSNNSSSRTGNRPASAGKSAWHRGLDAMRELLTEQGYLEEAAALGGSSDGYDSDYASVRHPLASHANTFEQQGDAGCIYQGDYADFDRWEGED